MNLEGEIRRVMMDRRQMLDVPVDAGDRIRSAMAKRRRRRTGTAIAAVALVIAAVGATLQITGAGLARTPESGPSPVPWIDVPAPAFPTLPIERPCSAADLSLARMEPDISGSTSQLAMVVVRNTGASSCTLPERSSVSTTVAGTYVRVPTIPITLPRSVSLGGIQPVTVEPGQTAVTYLGMTTECNGTGVPNGLPSALLPEPSSERTAQHLALDIGSGYLALPGLTIRGTCGDLQADDWYFPYAEAKTLDRYSGLTARITHVHFTPTEVDFIVTLTNPTGTAVTFDKCPGYGVSFAGNDAGGMLNCVFGSLPAGDDVRLTMRLATRFHDPDGATLEWYLIGLSGIDANVEVHAAYPGK